MSVLSMVKDGYFGHCGKGFGEHLVNIKLRIGRFEDEFLWDIANPDNSPEEFASCMVAEHGLGQSDSEKLMYIIGIVCEIRRQIILHVCRQVQKFSYIYESYVKKEIEALNILASKGQYPDVNNY